VACCHRHVLVPRSIHHGSPQLLRAYQHHGMRYPGCNNDIAERNITFGQVFFVLNHQPDSAEAQLNGSVRTNLISSP
jgi:hypothetical protein